MKASFKMDFYFLKKVVAENIQKGTKEIKGFSV